MPRPGQPGTDSHLVTVRGLLIAIVAIVTAGSAGVAAGVIAAAQTATAGSATTMLVASTAGLATAATTALTVASRLHKLIKRE
jgi:hypothetical protein